ncbi:MAG: ABC transporter ATP-binding protein [Nitrosomonadales bacterium]|nr:ABC transporter ATP-binding protein [Nitrosomonadales bacterium]
MIRLEHVKRSFTVGDQPVAALRDISLHIAAGEYVSIMGPSGSGKSTLLNMIGLLDRPDAGLYLLAGQDVSQLNEEQQAQVRRDKIGFVFQFFHLVPRLTAAMNIELPLILAGVDPQERKQRVDELLASYGLTNRADHRPEQLSGGQRQRVAIARATIMRPAVLLADEPTGNLDRATGREVMALLEGLTEQGVTLILVTHDHEIGDRAQRQLVMVDGQLASDTRQP